MHTFRTWIELVPIPTATYRSYDSGHVTSSTQASVSLFVKWRQQLCCGFVDKIKEDNLGEASREVSGTW